MFVFANSLISCDRFKIEQVGYRLNQDVSIQGNLTRFNRETYLNGRVNTELRLNCSRCLGSVDFPIHAKLFARFIPREAGKYSSSEHELQKSEIETEFYSENHVDISHPVYDAILLDLIYLYLPLFY